MTGTRPGTLGGSSREWYGRCVSGTYVVSMGDRGRFVVPADLRLRLGWEQGVPLHLVETDQGVVVMTREQLKSYVRRDLSGLPLVSELLEERRAAAARENVELTG